MTRLSYFLLVILYCCYFPFSYERLVLSTACCVNLLSLKAFEPALEGSESFELALEGSESFEPALEGSESKASEAFVTDAACQAPKQSPS